MNKVTKENIMYCANRLYPDTRVGHLWVKKDAMSPLYPLCDPKFKKHETYSLLRNYPLGNTCKWCERIYNKLPDVGGSNGK